MRDAREIHVSLTGSDHNPGTKEKPWRTLAKVNSSGLLRGETLILESGARFQGPLVIDSIEGPQAFELIIRSSREGTAATIASEWDCGINIQSGSGLTIQDLEVEGFGAFENQSDGVRIRSDERAGSIRLRRLSVRGYGRCGIHIESRDGKLGFSGVEIADCHVYDIGHSGIQVRGIFDAKSRSYSHRAVVVRSCHVHDVVGLFGQHLHSGNGIVISDVDGAMIESCRSHDNGRLNTATRGGPIGIWAWDANDVTIQDCESYDNRTASVTDGGGFGLDGGCTNCRLLRNVSRNNDGAGYAFSQFSGARSFGQNLLEDNTSENDALRNGYGAIHFWSEEPGQLRGITLRRNKISLGRGLFGQPRAIRVQGQTNKISLSKNRFESAEALFIIEADPGQTNWEWASNDFRSDKGVYKAVYEGRNYEDVDALTEAFHLQSERGPGV